MTSERTRPAAPFWLARTETTRALTFPPRSDTSSTRAVAVAVPLYARVEVTAEVVELAPRCAREPLPVARTRPQTARPSSRANAVACAVAGLGFGARAVAAPATASASTS